MSTFTSGKLEIEFTAGSWTDVTSRMRLPLTIRQGRPTIFDKATGAILAVSLDNADGAMMPENSGSAFYPNVVKSKRIRWTVTKAAVSYTRFVGWIQSIKPVFDGWSLANARVDISATDGLGLLAQKKMRSVWSETWISAGIANSASYDVYEPTEKLNGLSAFMAYYGNGASREISYSNATLSPMSISTDDTLSVGRVMDCNPNTNSSGGSYRTGFSVQSTTKTISFFLRAPKQLAGAGVNYSAVLFTQSDFTTVVGRLGWDQNFTLTNLRWFDPGWTALNTLMDVPFGGWMMIRLQQNSGNLNKTDMYCTRLDTQVTNTQFNIAVDLRTIGAVHFPGDGSTGSHDNLESQFGGLVTHGYYSGFGWQDGVRVGSNPWHYETLALLTACNSLPVSSSVDYSNPRCQRYTGVWSDRTALEVLNDQVDAARGVLWAKSSDGVIHASTFEYIRPYTPLITIDCDLDMLGRMTLETSIDNSPTRVQLKSEDGTVTTVIDATTEAATGEQRILTVDTLSADSTVRQAIAAHYIAAAAGLRISQVSLDLVGATTDYTATLFDSTGTLGALYPWQRIRINNLPTSHFPSGQYDAFVQGWTETYGPDDQDVAVTFDLSRAPIQLFNETWTGSNGSAWSAVSWNTGQTATGGSAQIQGNQGRITAGTVANAFTTRRIAGSYLNIDVVFSFTPNQSQGSANFMWRADSTLASSGYRVVLDTTGFLNIDVITGGSIVNTLTSDSVTIVSGTKYRCRVISVYGFHGVKVWAAAGSEPTGFSAQAADTTYLSAGSLGLGGKNDGSATARTFDFDDFTLFEGYV